MAFPRRYLIIASALTLLLIIAITLATSIEIRAAPQKLIQVSLAQEAKVGRPESDEERKGEAAAGAGGQINGTGFDNGNELNGTTTVASDQRGSTLYISGTPTQWATATKPTPAFDGGMIGMTPTPHSTASQDDGVIGENTTSTTTSLPPATPLIQQLPILALSYAGSSGPKHCRGELVQKLQIPQPASAWTNGSCIDLPALARCGVFFAGKDAGCEAQLFNMIGCINTTRTYVNTVVFMPEERSVGALWRSMWIECGIIAPDAGSIDPSILGGLLKPKPGASGGGG